MRPRIPLVALALVTAILLGCRESANEDDASRNAGRFPGDTSPEPSVDPAWDVAQGSFSGPSSDHHPILVLEVGIAGRRDEIEIELIPEIAPKSVEQIVKLARERHYDGTTFHRVVPGFVIQGGDPNSRDRDPTNDGRGGAAVIIPDEFSNAPLARGVVALANLGRSDSNSSQFFIMHADAPALTGHYNVIGRVRSGIEVVDAIAETETDTTGRWGPKDRPLEPVVIEQITVVEPEATNGPPEHDPADERADARRNKTS